jgi:hypothetical protein
MPLAFAVTCPATKAIAAGDPIMPLTQVRAGMDCTADTVIKGTAISQFGVHVIDVVRQDGQGARILVRVSGPAVDSSGVAQGFSGSPVYCPDDTGGTRNVGAISETVGEYGNKLALVTPIEEMLGEPVLPPSSAPRFAARARPLLGPLTVSGLSPWLLSLLEQAGRRAGRAIAPAPAGPASPFAPQPLVPGASVAAMYSTGSVSIGALGTVTYRDGQIVYAFGHPLDGAGRRALLLQDAYVYDVVSNPSVVLGTSFKLAAPGHTEGTLTSDTPNAVIGQVGPPPALVPVDVSARDLDTGKTLAFSTQVADETDIGLPLGISPIDAVAPLSIAQLATQIYDGAPANQSGRMCFTVDLRESRVPLRFCNRYVGIGGPGDGVLGPPPALASAAGTDVANALALLDNVQFAALHVTRARARLEVRRGLEQASIEHAKAPLSVRRGHAVTVSITLRMIRGPLRTVALRLVVPRAIHGHLAVVVSGAANNINQAANGGGGALSTAIAQALGGGSGPPSAPTPTSLAGLRHDFAAIGHYDGLRVSFKPEGGTLARAYRDPRLLITGRTTLHFFVR